MVCKKKIMFALLFVFLLNPSLQSASSNIDLSKSTFANLVIHATGGSELYDYAVLIAQDLQEIGINVEIKTEVISIFPGIPSYPIDYDMKITEFEGDGASPDMREYYTEDGANNIFLLGPDLPYGDISEQMQEEGINITNLEDRQQHYYEWQELMMDKIIPMLPLYSPRSYVATWGTTLGYEGRWGIADSLPYMEYNGYHEGQLSLDEFNLPGINWNTLNPLFLQEETEQILWDIISESILTFSPDFAPLKTGIVIDWEEIDEFHYKFYMRDDVYWNPSYNVTARTASSDPLSSLPDDELMVGLKNGEFSNWTNQKVTAKDAVFSILSRASNLLNEDLLAYEWLSNIYVDPIDPLVFHINIDGNPDTVQSEHYMDFWSKLDIGLLPEFFLNSTDLTVTSTEGGIECTGLYQEIIDTPQWNSYAVSPFGCGKYMLDYSIPNEKTVLRANPEWFGYGCIDGSRQDLDFGTFNIHIIPDDLDQVNHFIEGTLDWYSGDEWDQIPDDPWGDRFDIQTFITDRMIVLAFNLRRPFIGGSANFVWLNEPGKENYTKAAAARKAICYAIDRDEINQIMHDGEYLVAHSVLFPFTAYYYYNDIIKYDYNIDKTRDWLSAALNLPTFLVTVLNANNYHNNITVVLNFTKPGEIVSTTVFYKINEDNWTEEAMVKESYNYFSYNFGSSFSTNNNVTFYFKIKTKISTQYLYSVAYSFIVGSEYASLVSSPNLLLSLGLFGLTTILIEKKKGKRRR